MDEFEETLTINRTSLLNVHLARAVCPLPTRGVLFILLYFSKMLPAHRYRLCISARVAHSICTHKHTHTFASDSMANGAPKKLGR